MIRTSASRLRLTNASPVASPPSAATMTTAATARANPRRDTTYQPAITQMSRQASASSTAPRWTTTPISSSPAAATRASRDTAAATRRSAEGRFALCFPTPSTCLCRSHVCCPMPLARLRRSYVLLPMPLARPLRAIVLHRGAAPPPRGGWGGGELPRHTPGPAQITAGHGRGRITRRGWGAAGDEADELGRTVQLTSGKGDPMADLIAIGYPNEATAEAAADEARRLARDLIIEPEAIAVIVRDNDGKYHVHTSHNPVGRGATWGMFWGLLFGLLFFIPVFGIAIGAGLGALMGKITKSGIDREFQDQVRGMLRPGTSALFLMVDKVTPDKAVDAMSKYGGTVLKTSLSKEGEQELQEALHGRAAYRRGQLPPPPLHRPAPPRRLARSVTARRS